MRGIGRAWRLAGPPFSFPHEAMNPQSIPLSPVALVGTQLAPDHQTVVLIATVLLALIDLVRSLQKRKP